MKKNIIIITTIVLVLITGVLVYKYKHKIQVKNKIIESIAENVTPIVTPTTDHTGMKLYQNKDYGFEFWYPNDWEVQENAFGSPYSKFNVTIAPLSGKYFPDPIVINIVTPDFSYNIPEDSKVFSKINLGGIMANEHQYSYEGLTRNGIIVPFGKYNLILGANYEYQETFDKIISTFTFTR